MLEFSPASKDLCSSMSPEALEADRKLASSCAALEAGSKGGHVQQLVLSLKAAAALARDKPGSYDIFALESSPELAGWSFCFQSRMVYLRDASIL